MNGDMLFASLTCTIIAVILFYLLGIQRKERKINERLKHEIEERKRAQEALSHSEKMYRDMVNNALVGIYRSTIDGNLIYGNRALATILEFDSADDLLAHNAFLNYKNPADRTGLVEEIRREGSLINREFVFATRKGREKNVLLSAALDGDFLYGMVMDITELKKAQERLQESEELYRMAIEQSNDGIAIIWGDIHLFVNQKFLTIFGYDSPNEIIGKPISSIVHPDDRERVENVAKDRQAGKEAPRSYDFKGITRNGETIYIEVSAANITYLGQPAALAFMRDVTERKQAEKEIRYLSFHDRLTNLYNRAFFEEELLRLESSRQMPLSVIMGDVNGLKLVNDVWGHLQGDAMLITIARILKSCCRTDDIVARWGGDEFIVLLPTTDEAAALRVAQRIRGACAKATTNSIPLSIALGVAAKEKIERDMRSVLKEAEDRMYRNKLMEDINFRRSAIFSLRKTLSERSHETEEHAVRVRQMAFDIGRAINVPENVFDELDLLATFHDIGKIIIPDYITAKQGALTEEEWDIIKSHTEVGWRIARSSPELSHIAEAILGHHERWDGKGYPKGLKGKEINLLSRILAIVDAYDVMTNERPYGEAMSQEEGLSEIERCAGKQFDPELVKVFIASMSDGGPLTTGGRRIKQNGIQVKA